MGGSRRQWGAKKEGRAIGSPGGSELVVQGNKWGAGSVLEGDGEGQGIIGAGQCYVMQGVEVQRRKGAEGQVQWVLENTEGEVRRRMGMGETGVAMDLDMVHMEYSDTLRFRW